MVILFAALFMALGLVNLDFGRNWLRGQLFRLAVGLPILLVYAYVEMPPLVFPQCFTLLLLTLVPNAAYSILLAARTALASRRVVSIRRTPARLAATDVNPTTSSTASTRVWSMPLAKAKAFKWFLALRPGWNDLGSRRAPISKRGRRWEANGWP